MLFLSCITLFRCVNNSNIIANIISANEIAFQIPLSNNIIANNPKLALIPYNIKHIKQYYYKLNKKNGINIKSYWEEDCNDVALEELSKILIKIAQEGGDLRDGIEKYRNEIIGKVSTKIDL